MRNEQKSSITELMGQNIADTSKTVLRIMEDYTTIASVVERTQIAMGKKITYKVSLASTTTEEIHASVNTSSH